jgi:hypothetical protein
MAQDEPTNAIDGDVSQGGMGAGSGSTAGNALLGDAQAVMQVLSGGLTSVPLEAAAGLVGRVQRTLQGLGTPGVQEVAQSLGQLQQALVTRQLDDAGGLLSRLAAQTMDVAEQQRGFVGERLRSLSGLLTRGSEQLR